MIDEFLTTHEELTPDQITELKALNLSLKDQYGRMETGWQDIVGSIEDDAVFESLQKMVDDVEKCVNKTLSVSKKQLINNPLKELVPQFQQLRSNFRPFSYTTLCYRSTILLQRHGFRQN